jgi:abelson tyrosine-protein kinase 1
MDSHHALLVRLGDQIQRFHSVCSIYAEKISPHSKFKYRELLSRVDQIVRKLREVTNGTSNEEEKILSDAESTFGTIMKLVR